MAGRLEQVQEKLATVSELGDIVRAMRAMAAARVQQAEAHLPGARAFTEGIVRALALSLTLGGRSAGEGARERERDGTDGRALVVFLSEHGFVGGYNEPLVDAAARAARDGHALYLVGRRGAALCVERGVHPAWQGAMATKMDGVPRIVSRLLQSLYPSIAAGEVVSLGVVFARRRPGARQSVERAAVLPLETPPAAVVGYPPLTNLPPARLVERLTEEYLYARLLEAAAESFASINAARLEIMRSATEHIDDRTSELRRERNQLRQDEITEEVLELQAAPAETAPATAPASGDKTAFG
jgi:F-type H+-transporting ATPase subunit gamma